MNVRQPFIFKAYNQITRLARPLARPFLLSRLKKGKEDPARLAERMGQSVWPRPDGGLVWLHGASVGETLSLMPIVEKLVARKLSVLVTSGTVTSAALMAERLPKGALHQFLPLDVPQFIQRFLNHWKPNLALIAESELWPNLIFETHGAGVPLILVNARMSEKSYASWKRWPRLASAMLEKFDLCLAQSPHDAERLTNLGAIRVSQVGNIKFDLPAPPVAKAVLTGFQESVAGRRVITAASTHAGEEAHVLRAHRALREKYPDLLTIIVPRHPERGDRIRLEAQTLGLSAVQRSRGYKPDRLTDIYIADTIGELGLFYRLSPIVFMGGSLVEHGGQNPIEPAKIGAALLHGPHIFNFSEAYTHLDRARGSVLVRDPEALIRGFDILLEHANVVKGMSKAGKQTVAELSGGLERTMGAIEPYLVSMRIARGRVKARGA